MYKVWIEPQGKKFVVLTGKVTPFGFERVRKMSTCNTLAEAQEKEKNLTDFQAKLRTLSLQYAKEMVGV